MKVSAILWHTPNKEGLYPIKIKFYNSNTRKNKYIATGLNIPKRSWSTKNNRVLKNFNLNEQYNIIIQNLLSSYNLVQDTYETKEDEIEFGSFGDLMLERIKDFNSQNRISAVKRYTTLLNHLKRMKLDDLPLQNFNKEHVRLINHYFINDRKLTNGALKNYHKVIKTALSYAEDNPKFMLPVSNPYHKFQKITDDGGTKKTLTLETIHLLDESLHFDLNPISTEFKSVSFFLFSFYLMGMRFQDFIRLKWVNIHFNEVIYQISKTSKTHQCYLNDKGLNIVKYYLPQNLYPRNPQQYKLTKSKDAKVIYTLEAKYRQYREIINSRDLTHKEDDEFKTIISKRDDLLRKIIYSFSSKNKKYIFGEELENLNDAQKTYNKISSIRAIVNKQLKNVAFSLRIEPFSFGSARHTFAYTFKTATGDIHKVSKALAHSNVSITENYLKKFKSEELYADTDNFFREMNSLYKV